MGATRASRILATAVVLASVLATAATAQESPARSEHDAAVATEIEHRLTRDRQVNAQTIDVDVRGGVVTLTGRVTGDAAKQRAEALAAAVPGVTDVRNRIAVSTGGASGGGGPGPIPERMPGAH